MRVRHLPLLATLLVLLLLASCSTTKPFTEGVTVDPMLTLEEKYEAIGASEVYLPWPEAYFEADAFLERYIELINSAEDHILISTFMGTACEGLEELYQAIADKAREGVDVYFVMDGISSYDMTASAQHMFPLYFLRESGVHLIEYNPLSFFSLINPSTLILRDHRKLVVVDGRWCAIGGMNMNYISLGADDVDLQRDSMYVFDSPSLASALTDTFVTIWNEASVEKVGRERFKASSEGAAPIMRGWLFNQGPGSDDSMSEMFSALFSSAKEEIVLLPYLAFFDDRMYESLVSAQERGVKVRILVPIDSREYVQASLFYDYHRLVEAGFEVWMEFTGEETGKPLLHQKLAVVDGQWTVIGSTNLNFRSMGLSHEIALVLDNGPFAQFSLEQAAGIQSSMQRLDLETALALKEEKGNVFSYLFSYYGG